MGDRVIIINSASELEAQLKSPELIICYFTAQWCGPCRAIAPVFSKLSNEFSSAKFLKIDIDVVQDHELTKQIRSVPTFMYFKSGTKIHEFSGASESKIKEAIQANL